MAKLAGGVLDELSEFFGRQTTDADVLCAQAYEPKGSGYDPATDMRLVRLVARAQRFDRSTWARVKRVVDELPADVVDVLRRAVARPDGGYPLVACRLPSALARGRELAEQAARERMLEAVHAVAVRRGIRGIALATLVLDADQARPVVVLPTDVEAATTRAVMHGIIDVGDEATFVVEAAVDAYVAARATVGGMKRADQARRRREREALLDEQLGVLASREARRFERRMKRAA